MFDKKKIQDVLWDHYTDADIMRQKPMVFRFEPYCIICDAVRYVDHPLFVQMMGFLLTKHSWVFDQVEMLTDKNFRDKEAVDALLSGLSVMKVGEEYETFIADTEEFVLRWAEFYRIDAQKKMTEIDKTEKRDECLLALRRYKIDEIQSMMFVLIVYNFHLVKKNWGTCLGLLTGSPTTVTSGQASNKQALPTFDLSRYKRSRSSAKEARN